MPLRQHYFSGNCRTVLIACLSPTESSIESSMGTLRLAEKARKVTNLVRRNVEHHRSPPVKPLSENGNTLVAISDSTKKSEAQQMESSDQNSINNRGIEEDSACKETTDEVKTNDEDETSTLSSSLKMKLKEAEEVLKHAKECSKSVAAVAERLKLNRRRLSKSSKVSICCTFFMDNLLCLHKLYPLTKSMT